MDEQQKLFPEFPPVTVEQWEEKIRQDLKGADYAKKLIRKTLDNITIKPYYTVEDLKELKYLVQQPGEFPYVRSDKTSGNDWEIRQDFKVTDIDTAIEKAHLATSRGVTSVGFDISGKGDLYYHDLRKLIAGLDLSKLSLNFKMGDGALTIMEYLIKALDELKVNRADLKGSLEFDPLGHLIATGGFYHSEKEDMNDAQQLLALARNELPGMRVLAVNSYLFGDAGASAVMELAYGLSMFSDYLCRFTNEESAASAMAKNMQWNLGIGNDYFMEIAKIRAARFLFSAMISGFDKQKEVPVYIHSITTNWNKTLYDPNVNMLRVTTEAMSAVLGGCNSLLVRPFDSSYNEPGDFSERMARNVQIILKEESYFNKVVDPSAGSYYIESLTNALIDNAWALFLSLDEKGGFVASFTSGHIGEEVKKTAGKRAEMVASRREILLGTNQYPNVNESVNGCIAEEIAFAGFDDAQKRIAEPIPMGRAAAGFEKLRLSTEKHIGPRPKVFLLTYGNLAMRIARAQFSGNFFACAGYDVIDNPGFKSAEEGVEAALHAKADIIVICSSDDEYAEFAPAVATLTGQKAIVVVAGAPANMDELKQKGITEFIHIRSNVLEMLKEFHKKLGIDIK